MELSTVKEQIRSFLMKHFLLAQKRSINNGDRLLETGILDSLGILEVVTYLEQEFSIAVADEDLVPENFESVEQLSRYVISKRNMNSH